MQLILTTGNRKLVLNLYNIIDVLTLVDFVQANNAGSLNPYLADVNADETINFLDMISIVREIMGF